MPPKDNLGFPEFEEDPDMFKEETPISSSEEYPDEDEYDDEYSDSSSYDE